MEYDEDDVDKHKRNKTRMDEYGVERWTTFFLLQGKNLRV